MTMADCQQCERIQTIGRPVTPVRTVTGATVQLLGCREHFGEVFGAYSLGLGLMAGASIGVATGASAGQAHELLSAAADILRGGAHPGCAGPKPGGCREHLRTYDERAARLRAALAAIVGPQQ